MVYMTNKLAKETSPYLQQHKENPIDWYPYSEEAFDRAKELNRPVFLSIGYSSCHWCHVMARESFEDEDIANFMNENFISIKIDREEHPGIDKAYQEMFQLVNRRGGGWPLSVFALPDGAPFVLATYIPKDDRYGMKSFKQVMDDVLNVWNNARDQVVEQATAIMNGLEQYVDYLTENKGEGMLSEETYAKQVTMLLQKADYKFGGIGGAPKFPRVSALRYLLQEGIHTNNDSVYEFVRFTYHKMSTGGIYDQLGGGFARYSVDIKWLVPHFEKMLYDNAGLLHLGSELYAALNDNFAKWVIFDTVSWVAREMRSKYGGFFSTLNAESEGREGKFYVWTKSELKGILGNDFELAEMRFGITEKGNFKDPHHPEIKGMNILSVVASIEEICDKFEISEDTVVSRLSKMRQKLFGVRGKRIAPSRDTKIITSWNGLMIDAMFSIAEKLDLEDAATLAINAIDYIVEAIIKDDKILHSFHEVKEGQEWREIEGYLDDYSFAISALISAFEYTDDWRYIEIASRLEKLSTEYFYNEEDKIYYVNRSRDGALFNKVMQASDESMMSGFAKMVDNLFKLGKYLEKQELVDRGKEIADKFAGSFNDFPGSMNGLQIACTNYLRYPTEIVLVDTNDTDLDKAHSSAYIPHRLVYRWNNKNRDDGRPKWNVLEARLDVDRPTVYICEGMTCSLPLSTADDVIEELKNRYVNL